MDKQLLKRGSIVVASALTIFGLSVASPSMASTAKNTNHVAAAAKKAAATPAPSAPAAGGNLAWGGPGAGAGQGDDDGDGPQGGDHGRGGHGKGPKGDHGKGPKGGPANLTDQTVTVNVPADSSVYVAVITEVVPAAPAPATGSVATPPARPAHVETVSVSGTGSQTVTFKGIAGQAYTVQLVKVVSVQSFTGK